MMNTERGFRPPLFLQFLGAVLCGMLATASFAPYAFWPAMLLSLLCFLLLIDNKTPKQAAFLGLGWGLGQFGSGIAWVYVVIENFGGLPLPVGLLLIALLVFYLALFPAAFAFLSRIPSLSPKLHYWLFVPSLWLVIDWLRGSLLTGFPWLWAGYSQIDAPFAPIAPMLGVQGITLVMLLFVSSLVLSLKIRSFVALIPAFLVVLFCFIASHFQWVKPTDKSVDVAMVQANVPQALKWLPEYRWSTLLTYQDLTRKNWDADIIIWPEAAIPATENELPEFLARLDSAARYNNSAIITGILDETPEGKYFNNVISLGNNGEADYRYPATERYSKHHLLVFGEFVPFEEVLRPLAPMFNLPMSSFTPGDYHQPNLTAKGYELAAALCYEIAFNEQVRRNILPNSDFILTLSNDTWFGKSIGPHQHLEIARMRALENGKPLLRATNTGLTAAIDHKGKIIEQVPQFETVVLRTKVTTTTGQTPYTLLGNLPLYCWVGVSFFLCLIASWRARYRARKNAFTQSSKTRI